MHFNCSAVSISPTSSLVSSPTTSINVISLPSLSVPIGSYNDSSCFFLKVFEKPLSEQEEKEMLIRSRNGDIEARNILVEKNMRLVAHMIKKYACAEKDTQDLISVGTIGLIKAVNTFNPDKKIRLATYAA